MTARDDVLGGIRRALGRGALAEGAAGELDARVAAHRRNLIPARAAALDPPARIFAVRTAFEGQDFNEHATAFIM